MNPEISPYTATGEFLDRWASQVIGNPRHAVRFKGWKFIWYFIFPLKSGPFELRPPRGHRWATDQELRERIMVEIKLQTDRAKEKYYAMLTGKNHE